MSEVPLYVDHSQQYPAVSFKIGLIICFSKVEFPVQIRQFFAVQSEKMMTPI